MAELLQIKPQSVQTAPGQIRVPTLGGEYAGRGLEELGLTGERILAFEQRQKDAEAKTEAARLSGEWTAEFATGLQKNHDTITNPDEFQATSTDFLNQTYQNKLAQATSPASRKYLTDALSNDRIRAQGLIDHGARAKRIDKLQGDYLTAKDQYIQMAAATLNEQDQLDIAGRFGDLVGNMTRNGAIGTDKAPGELIDFRDKVKHQTNIAELDRYGQLVQTAPEQVKGALDSARTLTGEQKYAIDQRANEAIREKRVLLEQENKARIEDLNQGVLERVKANGANLTGIREQILSDRSLPSHVREHWVDEIDSMLKARRAEAEGKAKDPFTHSNPAVLAQVMKGIILEPDKWDKTKVLGLMGPGGLSITHALMGVGMIKENEKSTAAALKIPSKANPLANALDTIEELRKGFQFIPEKRDSSGAIHWTPEDKVLNDNRSQEVFNYVMEAQAQKKDPQKALDEVMQPYYETEVTGFMNMLKNKVYGLTVGGDYTKDERIAARQFLVRAGQPVTEENIVKAAKHLREKAHPSVEPKSYGLTMGQ